MALNPVPQAGQTLNTTRPLILQNFIPYINMQFSLDHVEFGPGTDGGKHRGIHLVAGNPTPPIISTEIGIWNSIVAGIPALMIQAGTGSAVNITNITVSGSERTITTSQGLIFKFGFTTSAALAGNSWNTVMFGTPFPTSCIYVFPVSKVATAAPSLAQTTSMMIANSSFLADRFQVYNRRTDAGLPIATDCYYFAVGN